MSTETEQAVDTAVRTAPKRARVTIPQISLLPGEIHDGAVARRNRAVIGVGVLVAAALVGAIAAGASVAAGTAEADAQAANAEVASLNLKISKFAGLQQLQTTMALEQAAVRVGSGTAIDWQRQIDGLTADMPAGFTVTSIAADGATATEGYIQGKSNLERPRVATVTITASTPSIQELPRWIRMLKRVPSYADSVPSVNEQDGGYVVQVVVHLTDKAYVTPLKGTSK